MKSHAEAVHAVEGNAIKVGQRQSESYQVGPKGHYRTGKGHMVSDQNDNLKHRFVKKGDKALVLLGRTERQKRWAGWKKKEFVKRKREIENYERC